MKTDPIDDDNDNEHDFWPCHAELSELGGTS